MTMNNGTLPPNNISQVNHVTINSKYRIVFEKAASANRVDGFKVEAQGDDINDVQFQATELYRYALTAVSLNKPEPVIAGGE